MHLEFLNGLLDFLLEERAWLHSKIGLLPHVVSLENWLDNEIQITQDYLTSITYIVKGTDKIYIEMLTKELERAKDLLKILNNPEKLREFLQSKKKKKFLLLKINK